MVGRPGNTVGLRTLGFALYDAGAAEAHAAGVATIQLFRCFDNITKNHAVSTEADCRGRGATEFSLGHILAYSPSVLQQRSSSSSSSSSLSPSDPVPPGAAALGYTRVLINETPTVADIAPNTTRTGHYKWFSGQWYETPPSQFKYVVVPFLPVVVVLGRMQERVILLCTCVSLL